MKQIKERTPGIKKRKRVGGGGGQRERDIARESIHEPRMRGRQREEEEGIVANRDLQQRGETERGQWHSVTESCTH